MPDEYVIKQEQGEHGGSVTIHRKDGSIIAAVTFGPYIKSDGSKTETVSMFHYPDGTDDSEEEVFTHQS